MFYKVEQLNLHYTTNDNSGPLLVHCNTGAGQTGTYIALHNLLQQSKQEGLIDVPHCVNVLREQRFQMVYTVQQYK